MKINVGIVGYGNLGKAVEEVILANKKYNLVAIFSRRAVVSKYNTLVEKYDNFASYTSKIDIMFLCGGSKSDLEIQTPEILKYFDCINSFDTHSKIKSEFNKLESIAKGTNHRLIMSCGWDPGLFSVIRAYFKAIGGNDSTTFWGKGISMGHSDAIRRVDGVLDGIQFTVPNSNAVNLVKKGDLASDIPHHFRECYVVAETGKEQEVENEIKRIPNYFLGQPTTVNFVSNAKLSSLKKIFSHKGTIIERFNFGSKLKFKMDFSVAMDSNPYFTAKIMMAYEIAVRRLKEKCISGAFLNFDIPASFLFETNERDILFSLC